MPIVLISFPLCVTSDCVLINVLLLGVVDTDQGLDQLDNTLRVSNEVAISILGGKSARELS